MMTKVTQPTINAIMHYVVALSLARSLRLSLKCPHAGGIKKPKGCSQNLRNLNKTPNLLRFEKNFCLFPSCQWGFIQRYFKLSYQIHNNKPMMLSIGYRSHTTSGTRCNLLITCRYVECAC